MKLSDFSIGAEFFTGSGRWRCTDIRTRVIVAISLEPRNLTRAKFDDDGKLVEENFISNDPNDLNGPPFMIAEHVFDEHGMQGCYASPADVPTDD